MQGENAGQVSDDAGLSSQMAPEEDLLQEVQIKFGYICHNFPNFVYFTVGFRVQRYVVIILFIRVISFS